MTTLILMCVACALALVTLAIRLLTNRRKGPAIPWRAEWGKSELERYMEAHDGRGKAR
jgi:hypothetical protein